MRPRVTGFQFYIDEETLTGDGQMGNPIRVVSLAAPQNPSAPPGVSDAPPGQIFVDTTAIPHLAYVFTGPTATDWTPVAGTTGAGAYAFPYVATGAEDPNGFPVVFPVARPNANYAITATCGDVAALLLLATKTYTALQFTCKASAALTAGDVINFIVGAL